MKYKKQVKKLYKKYWRAVTLVILAGIFFVGASSFNYFTQSYAKNETDLDFVKWTSPDETANYIFAKLYGQTGEIKVYEKYNLYTKDIMHPRSFRSDNGKLKPVSFLGIIIMYGKIVSWTSYKILPFLTPIFAAIGIIYFYLLVKLLFGKTNAYLSAFLLAFLPPYLYYSARSMFHNVLFVVLLIIALYYMMLACGAGKKRTKIAKNKSGQLFINFFNKTSYKYEVKNWIYSALGGIFLGLVIITRSSEIIWLGPALFLLWLLNIRRVGITKLVLIIVFAFTAMLPALYHNEILYGSMFMGGYSEMNQSIAALSSAGNELIESTGDGISFNYKNFLVTLRDNIFHFGFHPKNSLRMGIAYFVKMFWWIFWPALLGFLTWAVRWKQQKFRHWVYLLVLGLISGLLLVYYGSWEFHDNPDPNQITIGNSYTRYWLPIYIGSLPFVSYFIIRLTSAIKSFAVKFLKMKYNKKFLSFGLSRMIFLAGLRSAAIVLIAYISIGFVVFGSAEGLLFAAGRQAEAKQEWAKLIQLTESNSTVITRYHDKLLFPERKVIVGLFDDKNMIDEYANLTKMLPVYYYNFDLPEKDIEYLNGRRLAEARLGIEEVAKVNETFTLYRLIDKSTTTNELIY